MRGAAALVVAMLLGTAAPAVAQQQQGTIVFYRPTDASPSEVQLTIGATTARLRPGRTLRTSVEPGFAVFGAIAPNGTSSAATLDVVAGVLYAIKVTVRENGEVTLVQVPSLDAEREMAGLAPEGGAPTTATATTPPPTAASTGGGTTTTGEPSPGASTTGGGTSTTKLSAHEFKGRVLLGANVLGGQVNMGVAGVSGYRLAIEANGLVARPGKLTLWVGGNFAFATAVPTTRPRHDVQLAAWVMLTFERFLKIPLVPSVRAGFALDFVLSDALGMTTFDTNIYAGGFRFGGGLHWYVTPRIGVGIDTNFTLGGASYPTLFSRACVAGPTPTTTCGGFFGTWDIGAGALFSL